MPRQRFKKAIANFSKGFSTYFGETDIADDVFVTFKNFSNFFPGKLTKSAKEIKLTENDRLLSLHKNGGYQQLILYKSDWAIPLGNFNDDDVNEGKEYYLIIGIDADGGDSHILIHEASTTDLGSGTTLTNSWGIFPVGLGWDNVIGTGTDMTPIKPDIYVVNNDIRISDGNMDTDNISKWFGHIKRDIYGYNNTSGKTDGNDNYLMAPSPLIPTSGGQVNSWFTYDHHLKAPVSRKLTSYLDRENLILTPGEVGIYVQDPTQVFYDTQSFHSGSMPGDIFSYPLTQQRQLFHTEDRYATTFVYDYVSESELSRDEFGNIGISGFKCYEPPDILDEENLIYEHEKDDGTTTLIKMFEDLRATPTNNLIVFGSDNSGREKDYFTPGDVIRMGSETMIVTVISPNSPDIHVIRGAYNTSVTTHSTEEEIYRVQKQQSARAVSIVVNTGAIHAIGVSTNLTAGANNKIAVFLNTSLGKYGQKCKLSLNYDSGMTDDEANIGMRAYNDNDDDFFEIVMTHRGFTVQDIADVLNTGAATGKTIHYPGWDATPVTNQTYNPVMSAGALQGFIQSAEVVGDPTGAADTSATTSFYGGSDYPIDGGGTSDLFLNQRITGINLYWQPKGETNWYLVNSYDMKKCLTDESSSVMEKYFTGGIDAGNAPIPTNSEERHSGKGNFIEKAFGQSGNIGAWIAPPFLHPLATILGTQKRIADVIIQQFPQTRINRHAIKLVPESTVNFNDIGTITNQAAAPKGAIVLASLFNPTISEEESSISWPYTYFTEQVSGTFYGNISKSDYSGNAKINNDTSANDDGLGGAWGKIAFISGSNITNYTIGGGDLDDPIYFDKSSNEISFHEDLGEHLDYYGYEPGDYIFISTNVEGHPNNGLYRISTEADAIDNGGAGSNRTTINIDPDFKEIATTGYLAAGITPLCGAKYLTNDLGCSLTEASVSLYPGFSTNNGAGISNKFNVEILAPRADAIATRRIPHYGFKDVIYQERLSRAGSDRINPVRWVCSNVIAGISIIGNVEVEDNNGQIEIKRSKIMWSEPRKPDTFTIGKSRTVGRWDGDPIVALENIQNALYVIKEKNVYVCDPSQNFRSAQYFPGAGTKWKNAVIVTPKGLAIANQGGIMLLPEMTELTLPIRDEYQKLTKNNPVLGFSPRKGELVFIPDTSEKASQSRERYLFNLNYSSWSKETMDDPESANQDSTISNLVIGETGFLEYLSESDSGLRMHRIPSTYNDASGVEITDESVAHTKKSIFELKSKKHTLDDPSQIKYIEYLYLTYKFGANITLNFYVDDKFSGEVLLPSHLTLKNRKIPIKRQGKTFQFELKQTEESSSNHLELEDIIVEGYYTGKN